MNNRWNFAIKHRQLSRHYSLQPNFNLHESSLSLAINCLWKIFSNFSWHQKPIFSHRNSYLIPPHCSSISFTTFINQPRQNNNVNEEKNHRILRLKIGTLSWSFINYFSFIHWCDSRNRTESCKAKLSRWTSYLTFVLKTFLFNGGSRSEHRGRLKIHGGLQHIYNDISWIIIQIMSQWATEISIRIKKGSRGRRKMLQVQQWNSP
jgi:hypothetical protein